MSKETPETQLEVSAAESSERVAKKTRWGRAFFAVGVAIVVCSAMAFQLMHKVADGVQGKKESEVLFNAQEPQWHLRLKEFPEQKILLGFANDKHIYMDASGFCVQPGFRPYVMDDTALKQADGSEGLALIKTPDIRLPADLQSRAWAIVSEDKPMVEAWFDIAYQWLGPESSSNACMYLGQKDALKTSVDRILPNTKPVIGLLGSEVKSGLRLMPSAPSFEVTSQNRDAAFVDLPWLREWMKAYATTGVEECGTQGEFHERVVIFPIEGKVFAGAPSAKHWIAATGCETLVDWSLVVTTHNGVEFVPLGRHKEEYDYGPGNVWTVDIDGDGNMEFLFDAQYYEGSRYVLLKLKHYEKLGWRLNEIAGTEYEGL